MMEMTSYRENTRITRLIYLSSKLSTSGDSGNQIPLRAIQSVGTHHKIWRLPPMPKDTYYQYKMNLRQLDIFHTFPNIPEDVKIVNKNPSLTVTIPKGNYTAASLADKIKALMPSLDLTVVYDCTAAGFVFTSSSLTSPQGFTPTTGTTAWKYLGLKEGTGDTPVTKSDYPPMLAGVTRIHVETNLPLYTLPQSGRIASVPVNVSYGDFMAFTDYDGNHATLCTTHDLNNITIRLTDQDGNDLTGYEDLPWGCTLELEPFINNFGTQKLYGR